LLSSACMSVSTSDDKAAVAATRGSCIFVSYTMRDGYLDSQRLWTVSQRLRGVGTPYVDLFDNCGREPQRHVFRMLKQARLVVACVTPGYLRSEWVRVEIAFARRHRIPIVPWAVPWSGRLNASVPPVLRKHSCDDHYPEGRLCDLGDAVGGKSTSHLSVERSGWM